MVVSTNRTALQSEFEGLISKTLHLLLQAAQREPDKYLKYSSFDIEKVSCEVLLQQAIGTSFENTIELVGGQYFPDIVANNYYGIEVKTTKSNHWKSIGSSVAEGTRIKGIERIYMLFGKLAHPIDFRCRPYEACLSEVVVTHSPRYQIDMNLREGETFFDKIDIPYDVLRKQENPVKIILDYYRKKLKPGETTWWADSGESKASNVLIRLWNSLSKEEKIEVKLMAYCRFPEIFGASKGKFNRVNLWLATIQGIVVPNVRDLFSAGGQQIMSFENRIYSIPKIIFNISRDFPLVCQALKEIDIFELSEYWGTVITDENVVTKWIDLTAAYAEKITEFPLKRFIEVTYKL